jgi:hypothetical protein
MPVVTTTVIPFTEYQLRKASEKGYSYCKQELQLSHSVALSCKTDQIKRNLMAKH